jgi:hypothetical protein
VNGDIFAFNSEVNQRFQHGVPKARGQNGPRFSIIAWGRRRYTTYCVHTVSNRFVFTAQHQSYVSSRTINERNGGGEGASINNMEDKQKMNGEGKPSHTYIQQQHHNEEKAKEDDKEIAMAVHEVTELVDKFVLQNQQQAKGNLHSLQFTFPSSSSS